MKLDILGYSYELRFPPLADLRGNMGTCDTNNQVIEVASNIHMEAAASTLLHEIVEAINYHMELNLEHSKIVALEVGLYNILSRNGMDVYDILRRCGYGN